MNKLRFFILVLILFTACKRKQNIAEDTFQEKQEPVSFFPVTAYLKGQMYSIRENKLNPIKYITEKGKTDSSWIKQEDLEKEMSPFLEPVIDSTNLSNYFTETKFLDQSVNAFTFTYDPAKNLPDSFELRHWDVYINPENGKVTRIYLQKNLPGRRKMQLTWQSDKWCKIVAIQQKGDDKFDVEREVKIQWDF